ncbi:hypothetical protein NQ318_011631 [Aromia moschata]|uniref:Uncharacterized protein n=1 Tax=Aromia moschata TaxID=1265417 RepID=A0AAV8Z8J6_9CUCU|nr:hypothetical protein NQ318_011631 [Aromia moschata]
MQRSLEQRIAIKFCVKLEKSAAETIPMLKKAFGVDYITKTIVHEIVSESLGVRKLCAKLVPKSALKKCTKNSFARELRTTNVDEVEPPYLRDTKCGY